MCELCANTGSGQTCSKTKACSCSVWNALYMCISSFFCLSPCTRRFPLAEPTNVPWPRYSALRARQPWIQLQIDWLHKRTDGGERWLLICERYKTQWHSEQKSSSLGCFLPILQNSSTEKWVYRNRTKKREHKTNSPSGNKTATQNPKSSKDQQQPVTPCSCQGANSGTTPEVPSILHTSST